VIGHGAKKRHAEGHADLAVEIERRARLYERHRAYIHPFAGAFGGNQQS